MTLHCVEEPRLPAQAQPCIGLQEVARANEEIVEIYGASQSEEVGVRLEDGPTLRRWLPTFMVVFPLPAGAMICAGPSGSVAAARCSGSSAARIGSTLGATGAVMAMRP